MRVRCPYYKLYPSRWLTFKPVFLAESHVLVISLLLYPCPVAILMNLCFISVIWEIHGFHPTFEESKLKLKCDSKTVAWFYLWLVYYLHLPLTYKMSLSFIEENIKKLKSHFLSSWEDSCSNLVPNSDCYLIGCQLNGKFPYLL